MQVYRKIISIIALAGFGLGLTIHVATFWGVDLGQSIPGVWLLPIGIFPLGFLFFRTLPQLNIRHPSRFLWKNVFASVPHWAKAVVAALFLYFFINLILFACFSEGTPNIRDGKYVLENSGTIVREITESEYRLQQAYVLRTISGSLLVAYSGIGVYFWYPAPPRQED